MAETVVMWGIDRLLRNLSIVSSLAFFGWLRSSPVVYSTYPSCPRSLISNTDGPPYLDCSIRPPYAWEQRELGEVASKIGSGKTPRGGERAYKTSGIPLIRSQNVNSDRVDLHDVVYIDSDTDEEMKNSRVITNDVLLNITGASIGRSAVYKQFYHANVNQHVCIVRPVKGYSAEFVQQNLASNKGQKQIDSSQAGGAREGLNFQQVSRIGFRFPVFAEQEAVSSVLAHLDHLITLHQRAPCDDS